MNKSEYHQNPKVLLSDTKTYKKLKKDCTNICCNKLLSVIKSLNEQGVITIDLYRRMYPPPLRLPSSTAFPRYINQHVPFRPTVASQRSLTYNAARYITDILSPLVGHTPRHIKGSADLVKKLLDLCLAPDETFVSYNVTALYSGVLVQESLAIIHRRLEDDPTLKHHTPLSAQQVTDILEGCLFTTYIRYEVEFYVQIEGAAMGSPVSSIVANLFTEDFEEKGPYRIPSSIQDTMIL